MKARILAPENRKWWTLGAVAFGLFMIMLDNTIVNVALPAIQRDLHIGISELEWVFNGYALTFGVLMLTGGKLADLLGRRRIFIVGLVVFTAASLACGLASSAGFLIGARVVQGVGSALMNPVALFALTYGLIEANKYGWTSGRILGLFVVAVVGLVVFVALELRQRAPMLDLSLFKNGTFAGANSVMLLVGLAMFGVFFYNSLFIQNIMGYSAVQTGATFLPMTGLIILVAPVAGRFSDRVGSRWMMGGGMVLLSLSLFIFSRLDASSNFWDLLPGLIVGGFGMGLVMTPTTAAAMGSVAVDKAGVGSAVLNSMRQVGGSLGIAVMGAIVASEAHAPPGTPQAAAEFVTGFQHALVVASLIALAGAVLAVATVRKYRHLEAPAVEAAA